jgi:hypothetical protein
VKRVTYVKDIGWLLLLGLLSPVLMALALGSLGFVVARHLYWWATRHREA